MNANSPEYLSIRAAISRINKRFYEERAITVEIIGNEIVVHFNTMVVNDVLLFVILKELKRLSLESYIYTDINYCQIICAFNPLDKEKLPF
ncbi:MAG TPA: hypothetical protein PLC90_04530 [Bacteroidales bacterium]|jgi:hypothetical protein|nr:hypothetical protein [Bacteroidales bacterium]